MNQSTQTLFRMVSEIVKDEPDFIVKKILFVKDEPDLLDVVQSYHPKGLPKRPFSQKSQVKDETNDKDKYILLPKYS